MGDTILTTILQAQGGGGGSALPGCGGGGLAQMLPMGLMFLVFYMLIFRPQQKKAREHQQMLAALTLGDEIVTNGGIVGKVAALSDRFITLEVSDKTRIRVLRSHILGKESALGAGADKGAIAKANVSDEKPKVNASKREGSDASSN